MYLTAGYMDTPPVVILPDATFGLEILQLYRRSRYTDYWILSVGPDVLDSRLYGYTAGCNITLG